MYKKGKKLLAWCLVLSMVLTQMIFTNVAFAAGSNRLYGSDRYETALRISQNGWAAGSTEYAVLAYGEDFPDALSAAPLAKKYNAPILLTDKAALSAGVLEEINRVGAKNVFVVGGEGVVSTAVADALTAAGKTVTRLAGSDRYATSLKVAEQIGTSDTVAVAYGEDFPDALSIAPIAAAKGWPILLTGTNSMDAAVKAYIGSKKAYVVGGSGVVSDAVVNGLSGAERLSGSDRYATNVAVMSKFAADLDFNKVFLATGENFADALAGAAYAAKINAPLVLVWTSMAAATEAFVDSKVTSATEVIALGGNAVVPESAITAVGGGTQDLSISDIAVTTQDGRNVRISFNKPVTAVKASDITITQKSSQAVVGVEKTEMSSDNMSVNVTLQEEAENYSGAGYIKALETYNFTIKVDGRTLALDYTRPGFDEIRVVGVNVEDRIITGDTSYEENDVDFKVPADVNMDFADVMGRKLSVWYNEDKEITKFAVQEETVKYDAIQIVDAAASSNQIKLITEDKKYSVAKDYATGATAGTDDLTKFLQVYANGVESTLAAENGEKYDYAKVVFDNNGKVVFVDAADWENFIVVEKVEGDIVYGYGEEVDAEDFVIVKDGKTIGLDDLKAGDVFFYNDSIGDGFAEVYNKSVTGSIEDIFTDRVTVAGKDYTREIADMAGGALATKYINEDGDLKVLPSDETDFQDVLEAMQDTGDVNVFLNRYGKMVYLAGSMSDLVKTSTFNLVTAEPAGYTERTKDYYRFDTLNAAGEEVKFDVAASDVDETGANTDDMLYDEAGNLTAWAYGALTVTPGVAGDVTLAEPTTAQHIVSGSNTSIAVADHNDIISKYDVVKAKVDKDGDLAEVNLFVRNILQDANFKTTENYYNGKKINSDAPVFLVDKYVGTQDVDDIDVTTYSELNFDYIDDAIFYEDGGKIVAMVVYQSDKDDDVVTHSTVATGDIVKLAGNDNVWKLPIIVDGKKVSLFTEKNPTVNAGAALDTYGDETFLSVDVTEDGSQITSVTVIPDANTDRVVKGTVRSVNTVDKEMTIDVNNTVTTADDVLVKLGDDSFIEDDTNSDAIISLGTIKVGNTVKALRVVDNGAYVNVVVRLTAN